MKEFIYIFENRMLVHNRNGFLALNGGGNQMNFVDDAQNVVIGLS